MSKKKRVKINQNQQVTKEKKRPKQNELARVTEVVATGKPALTTKTGQVQKQQRPAQETGGSKVGVGAGQSVGTATGETGQHAAAGKSGQKAGTAAGKAGQKTRPAGKVSGQKAGAAAGKTGQKARPAAGKTGQKAGAAAGKTGQKARPAAGKTGQKAGAATGKTGQTARPASKVSGQKAGAAAGKTEQKKRSTGRTSGQKTGVVEVKIDATAGETPFVAAISAQAAETAAKREAAVKTTAGEPFSTEAAAETTATEPFSTEVAAETTANEPFSTVATAETTATELSSTEAAAEATATKLSSTEATAETTATELSSTEAAAEATTEPSSTEATTDTTEAAPKQIGFFSVLQPFSWVSFAVILLYYEVIFHTAMFGSFGSEFLYPALFALGGGTVLSVLLRLLPAVARTILSWLLTAFFFFVFCGQRIYFSVFKGYMALSEVSGNAGAITEFWDQASAAILDNIPFLLLSLLPFAWVGLVLHASKRAKKRGVCLPICVAAAGIGLFAAGFLLLPLHGKEAHTPYALVHQTWVQDLGYRDLGLLYSVGYDVKCVLFGDDVEEVNTEIDYVAIPLPSNTPMPTASPVPTPMPMPTQALLTPAVTALPSESVSPTPTSTPTPSPSPTPTPIDTSPNVMDIDFLTLAETEENETIAAMHRYFAAAEPTNKNAYTGMFEGYNLIMLVAEAYSPLFVSEELTPTLYQMYENGFQFTNYYQGVWFSSTSDGEYIADTGLYPQQYTSMKKSADNLMYFCLGNAFARLNYTTLAYHNHSYTYYDRNLTHPNLGYEFLAPEHGLDVTPQWPESDLEMMELSVDDFIQEEPFHVYYMTVSGHKNYTFSGNRMAKKNQAYVEALPYSEPVQAYIACNLELEFALTYLIETLTEAGVMDRTVIALTADHYPYGLEKDEIDELAGHEVDEYFELYKNNFLIWSPSMEAPVRSDKACSNVDVLPTLLNLFGVEYDSRLLIGQDILSDAHGIVLFNNWSYLTDLCSYNTATKERKLFQDELPEGYLSALAVIQRNRYDMSKKILDYDYYSYLFESAR